MLIRNIFNNYNWNNRKNLQEQRVRLLNFNLRKPLTKDVFCISFGLRGCDYSLRNIKREFEEKNTPVPPRVKALMDKKVSCGEEMSLYDLQMEAYSGLLGCKTLKEAKDKFKPEFDQVVDSKSIKSKSLRKDSVFLKFVDEGVSGTLKNGESCTLNLDNLSLELLKLIYAQNYTVKELDSFFNLRMFTTKEVIKKLNIKTFSKKYTTIRQLSNPEILKATRERCSQNSNEYFANETEEQKARRIAKRVLTPEGRDNCSNEKYACRRATIV